MWHAGVIVCLFIRIEFFIELGSFLCALCMPFGINETYICGLEIIYILYWFGPEITESILHAEMYLSKIP